MTHWRSAEEKSRPCWIDGRATFTIVASSTTMNWARQTTTRTSQRFVSFVVGRRKRGIGETPAVGERERGSGLIGPVGSKDRSINRTSQSTYPDSTVRL